MGLKTHDDFGGKLGDIVFLTLLLGFTEFAVGLALLTETFVVTGGHHSSVTVVTLEFVMTNASVGKRTKYNVGINTGLLTMITTLRVDGDLRYCICKPVDRSVCNVKVRVWVAQLRVEDLWEDDRRHDDAYTLVGSRWCKASDFIRRQSGGGRGVGGFTRP